MTPSTDALSHQKVSPSLVGLKVGGSVDEADKESVAKSGSSAWTQWRGPGQDGSTPWLPRRLPEPFTATWSAPLAGDGVGGICANSEVVIVSGRDLLDRHDVFQCFDQNTGDLLWQHLYPAVGNLDYGNSPRATPYLFEDVVYTLGAFGHLCCLDLETGLPYWQRNLAADFESFDLTWGHSVSPIVVDDQLIVQPGGRRGFLAALDLDTGETIWKSGSAKAGYSGMVAVSGGGASQVITYDSASLGGWSTKDGRRLWTLVPPEKGDFNVPTVIVKGGRLLASTENNGTRWYSLNPTGTPNQKPTAQNPDLAPDCHSPVISGGRIFGIWNELYALDAKSLQTIWSSNDDAFAGYAALIASSDRLLCLTEEGEVLLISTDQATPKILSRHQLTPHTTRFLSHPAIVGQSLFIRVDRSLKKFDLAE